MESQSVVKAKNQVENFSFESLPRFPKGCNIFGQLTPRFPDKFALDVQIIEANKGDRLGTPNLTNPLSDLKNRGLIKWI